jgi:heme-degrading monooxygenase HmoA
VKDIAITLVLMIAIARFEVPLAESAAFAIDAKTAYEALASCAGFIDGEYGQNLDESTLWAIVTRWENVGSYRRALSARRTKLEAIPLLARAIDEPGAYEIN